MIESVRNLVNRMSLKLGLGRDWYLIILGSLVGTITGFGAVGFAELLNLTEGLVHARMMATPVWLLIVFPMVGLGLAGVFIQLFASEARGHGVPQVMRALIDRGGKIPLRVGVIKILASVLTVGSGGSAGTEGPIIQIGSVAGSVLGQKLRLNREQMSTLVGCGAAAGISSIFNAPIAGVFFVLEILLRDFSLKTFTPVVVASVFSAVATQSLLGENEAIFTVQQALHAYRFLPQELPSFLILGAICGPLAVAFSRVLLFFEDFYDAWRIHPMLKPVTGAIGIGILGTAFVLIARWANVGGEVTDIPPFFGNGYGLIHHLLNPDSYLASGNGLADVIWLLAIMLVFHILATVFTLGSGGSGGVFAPSLFIGATIGAMFGSLLNHFGLIPEGASPASYALVGMAAVVAAATHAPLTAILILFEMTRNVYVVLPIMLAAVVATVVAQLIDRDSIYTAKLRRAGLMVGSAHDLTLLRRIPVTTVGLTPLTSEPIYPSDPLSKLISLHAYQSVPDFVVVDQQGAYMGLVTGSDLRTALIDREAIPLLLVAELMRTDLPTISPDEQLDTVMDKFAANDVASLCLMDRFDPTRPTGLITRSKLLSRYRAVLAES